MASLPQLRHVAALGERADTELIRSHRPPVCGAVLHEVELSPPALMVREGLEDPRQQKQLCPTATT